MKRLDRLVALLLVGFFTTYIYLAFNFPLLPFEKFQSFKPNTMPKGIGIIGLILSIGVLFQATGEKNKDNDNWRAYNWKQFSIIILLLVAYATLLKPIGFIASTTLFLSIGSYVLGERNYKKFISVSLISSLVIWVLVDKTLGIYLSPLPAMFH